MKKLIKIFETVEKTILSASFLFLSFAVVIDIFQRKFFLTGFSWLEELSRYFFVFATFLGGAIAVSMDKHPKMTAVQNAIGKKGSNYLILLSDLICAGMVLYLGVFAFIQVNSLIRLQTITSAMNIPLWIVYAIIPLSLLGMAVRFALLIRKDILIIGGKIESGAKMDAELAEALAQLEKTTGGEK